MLRNIVENTVVLLGSVFGSLSVLVFAKNYKLDGQCKTLPYTD